MTEEEWLTSADPDALLDFLGKGPSERKRRLFACACCRRIWPLIPDERARRLVELSERYADGKVERPALLAAADALAEGWVMFRAVSLEAAWATAWSQAFTEAAGFAARAAGAAAAAQTNLFSETAQDAFVRARDAESQAWEIERAGQAELIREIFGNPFRSPWLDPAWLAENGPEVILLAESIYEQRRFEDMPLLGAALGTAGCEDADILDHCVGPHDHVRGCWILDTVLQKN